MSDLLGVAVEQLQCLSAGLTERQKPGSWVCMVWRLEWCWSGKEGSLQLTGMSRLLSLGCPLSLYLSADTTCKKSYTLPAKICL